MAMVYVVVLLYLEGHLESESLVPCPLLWLGGLVRLCSTDVQGHRQVCPHFHSPDL